MYLEFIKEAGGTRHEFNLKINSALTPCKSLMSYLEKVIPEDHNYEMSASVDDFVRAMIDELNKD